MGLPNPATHDNFCWPTELHNICLYLYIDSVSILTELTWDKECECYEEEVQPYRKTDYKPIIYIYLDRLVIQLDSN